MDSNKPQLKRKRPTYDLSDEELITSSSETTANDPISFLKNLDKKQQEDCLRYLKLATYKGDPTLEEDLLFLFNIEIKSLKSKLATETKWKKLLTDKLNKYESIRDRIKLRIEFNKLNNK